MFGEKQVHMNIQREGSGPKCLLYNPTNIAHVCVGEAVFINIKNLYPCMLMEWDCVLLCQCFSYSHHSYKKENLINFQHLISMQGWVQHGKHTLAGFVYNSCKNAKKSFLCARRKH